MRLTKIAAIATAALLAMSCAATKYVSGVDTSTIDEVAVIGPVSDIEFVVKELYTRDDSLSDVNRTIVLNALHTGGMPISKVLDPDSSDAHGQIFEDVRALTMVYPRKLDGRTLTPAVRDFLQENGCRYGVLMYSNGFRRDAADYFKRNAILFVLDLMLSIVFPGGETFYYAEDRQATNLYMMVADAQEDKILYYKKIERPGENPVRERPVTRRVHRMVKKFYKQ